LCETLRPRALQKHLELALNVADGIPANLIGDPGRLRQILLNLCDNAIKFSERGRILLRIENESPPQGKLSFALSDTGIGISREQTERIFANFTQSDSSNTKKYGGTGLGLSLAKRLIELMGGRIWLESELGRGSTFYFNARFSIDQETTTITAQPAVESAPTTPQLAVSGAPNPYEIATRNLRVLVADDSPDNRLLIKTYLKKMPWELEFAENGAEAVTCFASKVFDVVLMDIQMPIMDGDTATRTIRECERQHGRGRTPVIAVTASALNDDRIRTLEAGCDLHLTKPLKKARLIEAIQKAIDGSRRSPIRADETEMITVRSSNSRCAHGPDQRSSHTQRSEEANRNASAQPRSVTETSETRHRHFGFIACGTEEPPLIAYRRRRRPVWRLTIEQCRLVQRRTQ
jgi:hypothetical protein